MMTTMKTLEIGFRNQALLDVNSCVFPGGLQSPAFDSWRMNSSGFFSANYHRPPPPPPPPSAMLHSNAHHFASIAPPIASLPYHQRPTTVSQSNSTENLLIN